MAKPQSAAPARRRASDNPDAQAHWRQFWIEADRRQPFKVDGAPEHPRPRRRWFFGARS